MKKALMLIMLPVVFSSFSLAQSNKSVDFNPTPIYKQGRFIGGLAPELEKISAANEDTSSVNVAYPMKIIVKRATGDTNGKMLIFRAPTWRVAMRKIVGRDPQFEKILNSTIGHLVNMDAPFPDLELIFEYHNSINNASDTDPNPITPKGKSHFVQVMQKKLPPGKHNLRLGACIKRSDTLLNSVMDGWWWLSLVENIFNKSILGISFKTFLGYVKLRASCSATNYAISVKAKVPKIKDMDKLLAASELRRRKLKPSFNSTAKCMPEEDGKVLLQDPDPGTWLRASSTVTARVCKSNCPAFVGEQDIEASKYCPAPTPTPSPQYYIYNGINCGDTLFVAKEGSLAGTKMCYVSGCGNDCNTEVQFSTALAGPYPDTSAAQKALCSFLSGRHHNNMVPWGDWVKWGAKDYRCFHYSCSGALSSYCPNLPYY